MSDHLRKQNTTSQCQLKEKGTQEQRFALAALIEKAWCKQFPHKLPETARVHPDVSDPLEFGFESAILSAEANTIGYALMGLDRPFMDIWQEYMVREGEVHTDLPNRGLVAAAIMLGLPYELLWEAEFLRFFGYPVDEVIKELRG